MKNIVPRNRFTSAHNPTKNVPIATAPLQTTLLQLTSKKISLQHLKKVTFISEQKSKVFRVFQTYSQLRIRKRTRICIDFKQKNVSFYMYNVHQSQRLQRIQSSQHQNSSNRSSMQFLK